MSNPFKAKPVALTGKLVTANGSIVIGDNFQQLTNLRYSDTNPVGIGGHTKISTSVLAQPHVRTAHHFRKSKPVESHVIVQSFTATGGTPSIYTNDATIPSATANFTNIDDDDTTANIGKFADAPDGALVYCNGIDNYIWGGDEFRPAAFIKFSGDDETKKWNYTDEVTSTDTSEYATLTKESTVTATGYELLMHFENNVTDDGDTGHTVTNNNVTFSTDEQFGTYSAYFNGTNAYLTIPDHADFDMSGSTWTIDMWVKPVLTEDQEMTIFYQETDDNNFVRLICGDIADSETYYSFEIWSGGTRDVYLYKYSEDYIGWQHIAITSSASAIRMFIDGQQVDYDVGSPANYSSVVYIGYDANAGYNQYYKGYIDELRIMNDTAAWTTNFSTPSFAYGDYQTCDLYLGSILPISAINWTVGTANTTVTSESLYYWNGSAWTGRSFTDTTDNPTDTLAYSGSWYWTYTDGLDKVRAIDSLLLYWYKIVIRDIDDTTTITDLSVTIPWQPIKDLWDGELRTILACLQWTNSSQNYADHTIGVFEDRYDSADSGSYAEFTKSGRDITVDVDYILVGSTERLAGLNFYLVSGQENQDAATMKVSYWNGEAWVSTGTINDATSESGVSLSKSGFVTWNSPTVGSERRRADFSVKRAKPTAGFYSIIGNGEDAGSQFTSAQVGGEDLTAKEYKRLKSSVNKNPVINAQYEYALYWYKIEFSASLSGTPYVQCYYIGGIPAQTDLGDFNFPVYHNEAVWLLGENNRTKNKIVKGLNGAVNVFNGSGSGEYRIGDESPVVGGASLKAVIDNKYYPSLIIFKRDETWAIYGSGDNSSTLKISPKIGCVAPQTIQNCALLTEDKQEVEVVLFQGDKGVYATNGSTVFKISDDIDDVFDETNSSRIADSYYQNSSAFYDSNHREYHWLWTTQGSTTHDKEYVYDCERGKWYTVDRGTGAYLQCGVNVEETNGRAYAYGFLDSGYMVRLDNGLTFATATSANNRQFTFHTGDIALEDVTIETTLRNVALHMTSATATSNTVAISHYGDTKDAASTNNNGSAITALDAGEVGKSVALKRRSVDIGPHTYHSLKFVVTNSDDAVGFEPIYLTLLYDPVRQGTRG